MPNFALTALAAKMAMPNNEVILDDKGIPSIYVQRPPRKLSELLSGCEDQSVHPAFLVNGKQVSKLFFGKFQGVVHENRVYSLPGEDPRASITLDDYTLYCRNKGPRHHCLTAAEWAFLALCAKKDGKMPKGNNSWGKDTAETAQVAIPTYIWPDKDQNEGKVARVATGTGPLTWSDTGDLGGVYDLNGNIWEWNLGIRLVKGELQVIPYNNAAANATNVGADSPEWKAISVDATAWDNIFITPNGSGTTASSVKLDWVTDHWDWSKTITHSEDASHDCLFAKTTVNESVKAFAKTFLQAMALAPDGEEADYQGDRFWGNNGAAERCAYRGGYFDVGTTAGVFALSFGSPRSNSNRSNGGRPASYED